MPFLIFKVNGRKVCRKPGSVLLVVRTERLKRPPTVEATIIFLGRTLLYGSSDQPERTPGKGWSAKLPRSPRSCSRWGLPGAKSPVPLVVSYTTVPSLPDLPKQPSAVHFCGPILQLALTGRYPASCPAEPGLSSRGAKPPAIVCQTFRFATNSITRISDDSKRESMAEMVRLCL